MEQSKHSEEEIIKLGKKLVKELDLEYSVNTLARWMSHYLAELIENIDKAESNKEKKLLQQECCDVILKVWSQKESLPIRIPFDDLKPIIEILQVLKEEKESGILPRWLGKRWKLPHENQWASFADLVKNNSEEIFDKVVQINLHKDILCKDEKWIKDNKDFLSKEEISFLELIDVLSKNDLKRGVIDVNNLKLSNNNTQRIEFMFNELENLIDEQKKELLKIKYSYMKSNNL